VALHYRNTAGDAHVRALRIDASVNHNDHLHRVLADDASSSSADLEIAVQLAALDSAQEYVSRHNNAQTGPCDDDNKSCTNKDNKGANRK
jgi:hypothetical protein